MRTLPLVEAHTSCVARVPIFGRLTAEQQSTVGGFATPTTLGPGDVLHAVGDRVGQLSVVHSGRLNVLSVAASGREHLVRLVGPGDVLGEHAFLSGDRSRYRVEAAVESRLCVFDHADLGRLVARHPAIAVEMLRSVSDRLEDAERRLGLAGADVPSRVADYLLGLPARDGRVYWPISKKDVAAYLATTPESLSRALRRLERDGLISSEADAVTLLDPDGLESRASR